jgi:hypothetical protein
MDLPVQGWDLQTAMPRHELFLSVSRSERGVSAHALDAANFLVISHALDVSKMVHNAER